MYKRTFQLLAMLAFVVALVSTGLGGWANMTGQPILITEKHAWNDGLFMMMVAIFLLLLSVV